MAELNVKKCIQYLKVIKNCISVSEENREKFKVIKKDVNDILCFKLYGRDRTNTLCEELKDYVQEFSGDANVLNIKQAVRDFTTIIKKLSPGDCDAFFRDLENSDADGLFDYFASMTPEESFNAAWDCYQAEKYEEAFQYATCAFEGCIIGSYYLLGRMYEFGQGVGKNVSKAFDLYLRGAELGISLCQYKVYYFYEEGIGTVKDTVKAYEWLVKAADNGDDDAMVDLGRHFIDSDEFDTAFSWFSKAADKENRRAKLHIALCYEAGWGVTRDLSKAKAIYKELMDAGSDAAKEAYNRLLDEEKKEAERRNNKPTIRITGVQFGDTDTNNNIIRTYGSKLYTNVSYLTPKITFDVLTIGSPIEIWYKIYGPSGRLETCDSSKNGFTWKGQVNRSACNSYTAALGGFGNESKTCYSTPGTWRIEFYEGDFCLYKTTFEVYRYVAPTPTPKPIPKKDTPATPIKKSSNSGCVWFIVLGLIAAIAFGVYKWWYIPYKTDKDAPRTYVFATNLFLRSGKVADVEYNRIGKIPYGSELITYSRGEDGWAEVKANGKKGYVSSAFVLDSMDFHLLNGVWGNADAREAIPTAKCRLAILDYLKKHNLQSGELGWQIFTKPLEIKPNSVMYPRLQNGYNNFTDFAFILKNNQTQERSLVLYSFKEDETPVLMYNEHAPADGDIRNITYRPGRWGGYAVTYTKGLASSVVNVRPKAQARTETSSQIPVSAPTKVNSSSTESTPLKEGVSPKEDTRVDNPSGITITNVAFANANYNGTTITNYGDALYSDMRYLQPKITYKTTKPDRVTLMIRIITPRSVLLQGSSSPSDGTFTQSIPASISAIPQTYILMGWGSVEGTVYVPGKYIYEIWSKGHLLYRTNFTVLAR